MPIAFASKIIESTRHDSSTWGDDCCLMKIDAPLPRHTLQTAIAVNRRGHNVAIEHMVFGVGAGSASVTGSVTDSVPPSMGGVAGGSATLCDAQRSDRSTSRARDRSAISGTNASVASTNSGDVE
jgi:hypothetical protein